MGDVEALLRGRVQRWRGLAPLAPDEGVDIGDGEAEGDGEDDVDVDDDGRRRAGRGGGSGDAGAEAEADAEAGGELGEAFAAMGMT